MCALWEKCLPPRYYICSLGSWVSARVLVINLVYRRSWIPLSFLNYGRRLGKSRLHTAFKSMLGIKMRYMGVIWFLFSCSPTSTHRFLHNQNSCCISESMMKHLQKPNWKIWPPLTTVKVIGTLEVSMCWFLEWIDTSAQLHRVFSVE